MTASGEKLYVYFIDTDEEENDFPNLYRLSLNESMTEVSCENISDVLETAVGGDFKFWSYDNWAVDNNFAFAGFDGGIVVVGSSRK